jgi:tripartite-type tricarboxylate transporter receptor subunit TctC
VKCIAIAGIVLAAGAANAADVAYPTRPIRLIVPYPPGGSTDPTARAYGGWLSEKFGVPVVTDNRPGAGATFGHGLAAKAPPDGYTLLLGTSNELVMSPYEKMPYSASDDFAPISTVVSFPSVLVLHPSIPVATAREFVAFVRARPGKLNFATAGMGTTLLSGEMFKQLTRAQFTYVQYKGGGPAIIDLIAGHVDAMFATLPSAVSYVKNGRLRALMVTDR